MFAALDKNVYLLTNKTSQENIKFDPPYPHTSKSERRHYETSEWKIYR